MKLLSSFHRKKKKFKLKFSLKSYFFYFNLPLFKTLPSDSLFLTLFYLNIHSFIIFYYFLLYFTTPKISFFFYFPLTLSLLPLYFPFLFFFSPPTYHFFSFSFFFFFLTTHVPPLPFFLLLPFSSTRHSSPLFLTHFSHFLLSSSLSLISFLFSFFLPHSNFINRNPTTSTQQLQQKKKPSKFTNFHSTITENNNKFTNFHSNITKNHQNQTSTSKQNHTQTTTITDLKKKKKQQKKPRKKKKEKRERW